MENNHRRVGIIIAIIAVALVLGLGGMKWKEKREAAGLAAVYKDLLAKEAVEEQAKQEGPVWQAFTSENNSFSVSFPGTPDVKTQTMALPDNAGQAVFSSYEATDADASLYGVYEISGIAFTGNQADLKNALGNYIQSNSAYTLVSSAPGTFLGYASLDFLIRVQDNFYLKGMYVATGNRLYQMNVLYDKSTYEEAAYDAFVNSFRVR